MEILVNIVHPYTFKQENEIIIVGPRPEFKSRDTRLDYFVKAALIKKKRVLRHDLGGPIFETMIGDAALSMDTLTEIMCDKQIHRIRTTPYGTPINDERPEHIPEERWKILTTFFTQDSKYKELIGIPDLTFFIGGALEACLANAMGYHKLNHKRQGERMFYIPELCVCFDESKREEVGRKLKELDIRPMSYEQSIELINF